MGFSRRPNGWSGSSVRIGFDRSGPWPGPLELNSPSYLVQSQSNQHLATNFKKLPIANCPRTTLPIRSSDHLPYGVFNMWEWAAQFLCTSVAAWVLACILRDRPRRSFFSFHLSNPIRYGTVKGIRTLRHGAQVYFLLCNYTS